MPVTGADAHDLRGLKPLIEAIGEPPVSVPPAAQCDAAFANAASAKTRRTKYRMRKPS
jgi:hypothetical protein